MLAIFVGIKVEQRAVERLLEILERRQLGGYPVSVGSRYGKAVVVCRTGYGERRGEGAAKEVFAAYTPSAVLSARLASSVPDDVRMGDLVLCEKVYVCRGGERIEEPAEADRRLLALGQQAAREARLTYRLSNALSFAAPEGEPFVKERLPSEYSLGVVTTEDHSLAAAARERGVPFLAVRVALGHSCDGVPAGLDLVAEQGVVRTWRVLGRLSRPRQVPAIWELAMSIRRASGMLSAFTGQFLREWALEP